MKIESNAFGEKLTSKLKEKRAPLLNPSMSFDFSDIELDVSFDDIEINPKPKEVPKIKPKRKQSTTNKKKKNEPKYAKPVLF